jgi:protein-disulfide isomerase-like protein with CxxC motif
VTTGADSAISSVDFHFDIMCPWAYQASLWMRDVRDQLGLAVNWRSLVDAAIADPTTSDEVRADHDRVTGLGGWGVPTLVFGNRALFGPVLIEPPDGAAAVRLWQLITGWLEFPMLYEVQRPKREQDLRAIADTFRPYLEARDWITIQKETP